MTIGQLRILALDARRYWRKPSTHTIGSTLLYSDQIRVLNNKRGHYGPLSFLFTMQRIVLMCLWIDRNLNAAHSIRNFIAGSGQTRSPVTAVTTVKPVISSQLLLCL